MAKKKTAKKLPVNPSTPPTEQDKPIRQAKKFPIVGIGASAGGLAAFEAFFSGMPTDIDPGMAFVLVQHLAPDHKSILTDLIRRYTRMQVFEVTDGMTVQPNCTYIIPPNCDMAFLNGTLQLMEPTAPRGQRLPIDFFFRSLAQDQHDQAICIILSGTGSDGTLGVRAIKGEGGMIMVQNPASTEYDGMPRNAIATGLVDLELPPAEMPAQIMAYVAHTIGKSSQSSVSMKPKTENTLKKIFILLRSQVGHDFSQYKPRTIHRRIERRMAVHQIDSLNSYLSYLQQKPIELDALFRDLLIGVTSFFRDSVAFKTLEEETIPRLFEGKPVDTAIRIWSPGCSTGEEAYSIAILLQEHMEALKQSYTLQVFATDIDTAAIDTARAGLYPASIETDITPERLARFFTAEPDGCAFRINKSIRDMLIFSEQNVIKDPPFSKLDLISCRNLLIYMGNELQKKIIPLFHYALNPGGTLFLGSSESVGEFNDLFKTLNSKAKLYQRKTDFNGMQRVALGRILPPLTQLDAAATRPAGKTRFPAKIPLREITEKAILNRIVSAGALVNGQGNILYLHGRTGLYLEPTPGEAGVNNILKMARDGLKRELTTALHKAGVSKEITRCMNLRIKTNGNYTTANLSIHPLTPKSFPEVMAGLPVIPEMPLYLVILEEVPASDGPLPSEGSDQETDSDARITALNQELRAKEEYLQTANEELETSNEELKSSNEEMQSVNEELQSTNEELETSKEELQSVNEELATVNTELQTKVADLSRTNNDMNNLLAGTGIGTIFVDLRLNILRFTPTASKIINLITTDIGRPVGHIVSNLTDYNNLTNDVQAVLDTLTPKEIKVHTTDDKYYTLRILPYRTLENTIEGAVITFTDITEMEQKRTILRSANNLLRLAVVVRDSYDAITVHDMEGEILAWNPAATELYGWTEDEAMKMNICDRIPKERQKEETERALQLNLSKKLTPYSTQRLAKDGSVVQISLTSTALINKDGLIYAIATTERRETVALDQPKKANNDTKK